MTWRSIQKILFDTAESHPSDREWNPGRLLVLSREPGIQVIAIERGRELALYPLSGEDRKNISDAVRAKAGSADARTEIRRPGFLGLNGGAFLKVTRDNRGDPWSQGVTLRFGEGVEDGDPVFEGPYFYLEDCEIDAFLAALAASAS